MAVTLTPNFALVKPDAAELASNWDTQNATNMNTIDATAKRFPGPLDFSETTDQTITDTAAVGSPICGLAFTAPASGMAIVTVESYFQGNIAGTNCQVQWRLKTGATLDAGTITVDRHSSRAVISSRAIVAGAFATMSGMSRYLVAGLTAGNSYNVCTLHIAESGGGGTVFRRRLLIELPM